QEEKVYKKGDRVPGNATVEAIYTDRVLLNTNGKLEVLRFPENNEGGGLSLRSSTSSELAPMQPDLDDADSGAMIAPSGIAEPQMGAIPQVNAQNADQALAEIGLTRNSGGQGYRVVPGGAASELLRAMGGKENDVLISINGRNVGDPTQDQSMLSDLMQQPSVQLEWERDGRRFSTTFDPKSLGGM
ncbi:MAG TPA: type II secretion system protein N, partial [Pseudomonadales bacterium]|nr:type II secretion system protein N [Pseudomonadales bacterium]